jgi:hypothetical protein
MLRDARKALSRAIDLDDMLSALFREDPELHSFVVEVTNEYDDNNYSDYSRVTKVNGRYVDYNGDYEEENEKNPLPVVENNTIQMIVDLTESIMEKYGHGEIEISRGDYDSDKARPITGLAEMRCATALLNGEKIPVSILSKSDHTWSIHHAEVHGRYSDEDEFALFAQEGMMGLAFDYARTFGPLSEKTLNYFVLTLRAEDDDHEHLQEYLKWTRHEAA